ncbi:mechanosensitive ion channel family protein [Bacteroidota bacterium]
MDIENAINIIKEKFSNWGGALSDILPYLIIAFLLFIVFVFFAKFSKLLTKRILHRFSVSPAVGKLIANVISINILIIGLVVALGVMQLDKTVTSLLAGAGIVGIALGFAFQDLVSNIISGVIIAIRKPFNIGELIETRGHFGDVLDIRLRTIEMHNRDGQIVFIPSREVLQYPIMNYSRMGRRRIVLEVGVAYKEDLQKVKETTLKAVKGLSGVLSNQPIDFYYTEFGESSINFMVRFWIKYSMQRDYRQAMSDAIMALKTAFDENNITIPFPIRTLDFGIKGGEKLSDNIEQIKPGKLSKL